MSRYIVSGYAIVDNIIPYGETEPQATRLGGGAMYALSGIRLWEDDVTLALYTGRNFERLYGRWLKTNGIDWSGVVISTEHVRTVELSYNSEGTFTSVDQFADEYADNKQNVTRQLLEPVTGDATKGIYILRDPDPYALADIHKMCREKSIRFGTEFSVNHLLDSGDMYDLFKEVTKHMDFFSLNFFECSRLFSSCRDIEDAKEILCSFDTTCFLRDGTNGAYLLAEGKEYFAPMISEFGEQDPAGCGNTSTSSAFWALCEGYDPMVAVYTGAVTASVNAGQKGMIKYLDNELREKCRGLVERYTGAKMN